jgi:hypothetical protein
MDIQKPIDYVKMLSELMTRRLQLVQQRNDIEVELVKVRQLILAIFPLLPEGQEKKRYGQAIEQVEAESSGLQDAIKLVFSAHIGKWLTVSNVRDYLVEMGFDLSRYQANPLSSISTTLRRMVPAYLEARDTGDSAEFRRKPSTFYGA